MTMLPSVKVQLLLLLFLLLRTTSDRASAFSTQSIAKSKPERRFLHSNSNSNSKRTQSSSPIRSSIHSRLSSSSNGYQVNGSHIAVNIDGTAPLQENENDIQTHVSVSAASHTHTDPSDTTSSSSSVPKPLSRVQAQLVRAGLMTFIASMCVALPVSLFPVYVAHKLGFINKIRKECLALSTGQFCARWLLWIIPFCKLQTVTERNIKSNKDEDVPEPAVWVCNHTSMLDVFLLMAADRKLRGRNKRPLKIVYWQQLENNPVTKLLFRQAGFIPVQMAPGDPGTANDYDISSFKRLLKDSKLAFAQGFDIGILPEGQLNPAPESGLLPVFSGAFTLAKLAKRPVHMMALHGAHHLWHPVTGISTVTGRTVTVRAYDQYVGAAVAREREQDDTSAAPNQNQIKGRTFSSAKEFCQTFTQVVGFFGRTGRDLPAAELDDWLTGKAWEKVLQQQANENDSDKSNSKA